MEIGDLVEDYTSNLKGKVGIIIDKQHVYDRTIYDKPLYLVRFSMTSFNGILWIEQERLKLLSKA